MQAFSKLSYTPASVRVARLEAGKPILTGSVTQIPVKVTTVEVEPIVSGFNEEGNDFATISFD